MPERDSQKKKGRSLSDEKKSQSVDDQDNADVGRFPIIGIGASAGGLEALEEFIKAVKPGINAAFVIITHLDPNHPSMLVEILAKFTEMEVMEAQHQMLVEPNKVYIIPPGKIMSIFHRTLQLTARPPSHDPPMPIDFFLRSLAEDQSENAVAVILSGNGFDGTDGLRSVQANLGIVMVQSPNTAKYPSMPQSAISTGLADYIMAPGEIPGQIAQYFEQQREKKQKGGRSESDSRVNLNKIMSLVKKITGHDFSHYKMNTINRRIERRMSVHQIQSLAEYEKLLEEDRQEVNLLFKEFLIQVTKFFRDPEAFDSLKDWLRKLLPSKSQSEDTLRIWVPGCSSGEEAYSIAITVKELLEELSLNIPVHIFGTDIDEDAIVKARIGEYPVSVAQDLGEERTNKYFVKNEDILKVRKDTL
jgi:two-component system CheB/CheR fusion protein